jgi:outer membrane lipoprotein-sorting protein
MRLAALWAAASVVGLTLVRAVGGTASGACEDTDACLRLIEAAQQATQVLSARFEQTKRLSLLAEPLVSRGRFAFRRPDEVLWAIDEPRLVVRIDRQGLHLPDAPEVQSDAAALASFSGMMRQMAGLFTGAFAPVREAFEVGAQADGTSIRVRLVPRGEPWRRTLQSIEVWFATPEVVVSRIHIEESLGDSVDITFSDVRRNDAAASAAFAIDGPDQR